MKPLANPLGRVSLAAGALPSSADDASRDGLAGWVLLAWLAARRGPVANQACATSLHKLASGASATRGVVSTRNRAGTESETTRDSDDELAGRLLPTLRDLGRPLLAALAGRAAETSSNSNGRVADEAASTIESESLFEVIETGIIPRLMLAHQSTSRLARSEDAAAAQAMPAVAAESGSGSEVARLELVDHERFLEVVRFESEDAVRTLVRSHIERGVPRANVFTELLGTSARRLGELWEADECSFADVTIGLCRLHMVLREESTLFDSLLGVAADEQAPQRRVLLTTGDDEQHILGLVLTAEFFRQTGWQVTCEPGLDVDGIRDLLARQRFDVLGLSIARSSRVHTIRAQIDAFRKASVQQPLAVLVGGRIFEQEPEMVERLEADACCTDAREGPEIAEALVARLAHSAS